MHSILAVDDSPSMRQMVSFTLKNAGFNVSFDEIALAIFLVGGDPTVPVFLYGQLRFAQRLPVLIAGAVLLMLGTIALTVLITRLQDRRSD